MKKRNTRKLHFKKGVKSIIIVLFVCNTYTCILKIPISELRRRLCSRLHCPEAGVALRRQGQGPRDLGILVQVLFDPVLRIRIFRSEVHFACNQVHSWHPLFLFSTIVSLLTLSLCFSLSLFYSFLYIY